LHIVALEKSSTVYSCNSYLILGDWNRIGDINTVIDPGTDDFILRQIEGLSTGFGKVAVAQVILTHNHFDHVGGIAALKERYGARVLSFADGPGVDELIRNGQFIKAGDDLLEVVHTPGHSSDSVCLYAPLAKAVFSGDTQLRIRGPVDHYSAEYLNGLEQLAARNIQSIYSGHDQPVLRDAGEVIRTTVTTVKNSRQTPATPRSQN
jgi:glyoxylase-like metal-dependent hydrolase (beta-lactamase superfamily II)